MAPRKESRSRKMKSVEGDEWMMFEEEINALKNIIEDQNEQLQAAESRENAQIKKHIDSIKEITDIHEKEIGKLRSQIKQEKEKFENLKSKSADPHNDVLKQKVVIDAQKKEIESIKSKAEEEEKKHQETVKDLLDTNDAD